MKPADAATLRRFAKASNAFAFDLYARRRSGPDDLAFSPASLTTALAMAWAGARGETADEMRRALRVEGEASEAVAAAGALVKKMNEAIRSVASKAAPDERQRATREASLRVKNRLFGERAFRFERAFLALTGDLFGAPLEALDFAQAPELARERINDWAKTETAGRIDDLVPPGGLTRETSLVLVNAIYFLGNWRQPFDKRFTSPRPFFAKGAAPRPVPTMHQTAEFKYASGPGCKVLEMSYEGGGLALTIVLPDDRDGLGALEASLSADLFAAVANRLASTLVAVSLPTFNIEPAESLSLADDLVALGMRLAFSPGGADFTGIASPPRPADRLSLGAVYHKAFVKVDEVGTEATAATAVSMIPGGPPPRAAHPIEFRADHPFLFALRDTSTGLILFLGRVLEPKPA